MQIDWPRACETALTTLAQAGAALLVARMGVDWALHRYKKEKSWERKLGVYSEAIRALGEIREIIDQRLSAYMLAAQLPEPVREDLLARMSDAHRRLSEVSALGELLLPPLHARELRQVARSLSLNRLLADIDVEAMVAEINQIGETLSTLVPAAREELSLATASEEPSDAAP